MFLSHLVVTRFGPWKISKFLEKGNFGTKKGSNIGENPVLSKVILEHLGCSNKCF